MSAGRDRVTATDRPVREKPAWLAALDGLCLPCSDAEFYGVRKKHEGCEGGDCRCQYVTKAA